MSSSFKHPKKTLFLDRDGVINRRIIGDYVTAVSSFAFLDGVEAALSRLARKFDYILVVTNQQGIAKGRMTEADLQAVHAHMRQCIEQKGGRLDGIYYCPKHEQEDPPCRKPRPGMAWQAQADFPDLDFRQALMVGDSVSDLEFGQRLGMDTVLMTTKPDLDHAAYAKVRSSVLAELPSLEALDRALEAGLWDGWQ